MKIGDVPPPNQLANVAHGAGAPLSVTGISA